MHPPEYVCVYPPSARTIGLTPLRKRGNPTEESGVIVKIKGQAQERDRRGYGDGYRVHPRLGPRADAILDPRIPNDEDVVGAERRVVERRGHVSQLVEEPLRGASLRRAAREVHALRFGYRPSGQYDDERRHHVGAAQPEDEAVVDAVDGILVEDDILEDVSGTNHGQGPSELREQCQRFGLRRVRVCHHGFGSTS